MNVGPLTAMISKSLTARGSAIVNVSQTLSLPALVNVYGCQTGRAVVVGRKQRLLGPTATGVRAWVPRSLLAVLLMPYSRPKEYKLVRFKGRGGHTPSLEWFRFRRHSTLIYRSQATDRPRTTYSSRCRFGWHIRTRRVRGGNPIQ